MAKIIKGAEFVADAVRHGAPRQLAVNIDAALAQAEAEIAALLDAGDIDGAAALAEQHEKAIAEAFGFAA